ncbi:MAG: ABC transporter permease [Actinomycetota bacterium]|nr:ABC transporter permease [Actinomycetota bacterium]MDP2289209.1 ABC transporter permease [Actinomycetota bacterium]
MSQQTPTPPPEAGSGPPVITEESLKHDRGFVQRLTTSVNWRTGILIPFLSVVTALLIGLVIIVLSGSSLSEALEAYGALLQGSVGSVKAISETLTAAAPLILVGLSVALAFRAGLFNIGGEGQMAIGGMFAVFVGFSFTGLPLIVHLPLAIIAGLIGGAIWGFVPGILKAKTGAHEVIVTIMMNYIAVLLVGYLLKTTLFQREGRSDPVSQTIQDSAKMPQLLDWIDPSMRIHFGLIIALLAAAFVHWLLFRTTTGFEFRAVGANPAAARYAGMSVARVYVLVMVIAGGLAGLAGGGQVLGVLERVTPGFTAGVGFDGIAVALLGRSNPVGVVAAAVLFGGLRAGGQQMQVSTDVGIDLISVIQALIIIFVAAPTLISSIYRLKTPVASTQISKGWAS